ncbi:MAG: hypothetical protein MI739_03445 [Bacteroidales bacterium]|nr:hypothetical protein [Bacteroidales bacterium]
MLLFVRQTAYSQITDTKDKVGIGINVPETKLHIRADNVPSDVFPPIQYNHHHRFKDYDILYLQRSANSNIGPSIFMKGINGGTSFSSRVSLIGKGGANSDLVFFTSSTNGYRLNEVLRLSHNLNVGIGTSTPNNTLTIRRSDMSSISIGALNNTPVNEDFSQINFFHGGFYNKDLARIAVSRTAQDGECAMAFYTSKSSVLKKQMVINQKGQVGIGTDLTNNTKGFLLAVKGKIGAEEIQVVSQIESDFVFENDYKLKSLEEVEAFVKEYKHLPEIPSAKEFKNTGQDLAKTDDLMLRKIEELTLYMIEQNKITKRIIEENKELKERIRVLEQK